MSPIEAIRDAAGDIKSSTIPFYLIVTAIVVYVVWFIAIRKRTAVEGTWQRLAFWLLCIIGWVFAAHGTKGDHVSVVGPLGYVAIAVPAALVVAAFLPALKRGSEWARVASGVVLGVLVFGSLAAVISKVGGVALAIVLGATLGLFVVQALATAFRMLGVWSVETASEDHPEPMDDEYKGPGSKLF